MDPELEEMLKRIGWTEGAQIPLANKENKALQNELEKLTLRKAKAAQVLEREDGRYAAMQNHLKHVNEQNAENQKLMVIYKQHLETQQHKLITTKSEQDRVFQESRQLDKNLKEIHQKIDKNSKDLSKGLNKMEKLKTESSWDTEALKAWEESLKKRDDDNELLKKFSQQDEQKAKELESKRQNLQVALKNRQELLDKVVGDVLNEEQMLLRGGKTLKQLKDEQRSQTKQWNEAVNNLKHRDNMIDQTMKEISMVQALIQEQQELLEEQNNFLNMEIANNKAVDVEISEANLQGSKLRQDLNDIVQYVFTLTNEANTIKRAIIASANRLEKQRMTVRNLVPSIKTQEDKNRRLEKEVEKLENKLKDLKQTSTNANRHIRYIEQLREKEQKHTKNFDTEIERIQKLLFRTQRQMYDLKEIARIKETEISGCETSIISTKKYAQDVYNDLKKQKEVNYDLEFVINQMEAKLFKLEGANLNREEKQLLDDKILALEKELASESELKSVLQHQLTQSEEEMRRLHIAIETDTTQLETLKDKLQSEVLSFEGGTRQVKSAKEITQQKQVEENILRLRLNQMQNIIKKEDSSIINLQKLKLELETAMKEREIEIEANKEILLAKRRNLDEEKSRLSRDLGSRRIKIEQLKKRLHIALMALGKDENGQPVTITYFRVKNAQEKYFLQTQGDELDAKIKKVETEIVAMENTLAVVNGANVTYKRNLSQIGQDDQEMEQMKVLETELSKAKVILRNKKRECSDKKIRVKELHEKLNEAQQETENIDGELQSLRDEINQLQNHEEQLDEKIKRTDRLICASVRNITIPNIDKYKKNILIRQLQEAHKRALEQLAEASTKHSEMSLNIQCLLQEHGLQLPGIGAPLTPSSSCASSGSSRSSKYYKEPPHVTNLEIIFNTDAEKGARRKKS